MEVVYLEDNIIFIYRDAKSGKQYLMDKNKFSIYLYYPDVPATPWKIIAIISAVLISLPFLFGILNIETIRSLFYMDFIGRGAKITIVVATIAVHILFVLLYKRNFTKRYTGHKEVIAISLENKKRLLRKSFIEFFCLVSICSVVGAAILIPISIAFIRHGNAITYFWFLLLSSVLVRYPATIIINFFIPVLKFYLKLLSTDRDGASN